MKASKIAAVLLCMAVLLCSNLYSQASDNNQNPESSITLNLPDSSQAGSAASASSRGASTFWVFFRMILVLGIVAGCIYFAMNFMKKSVLGESDSDPFLRKVASISLSPGKSVHIVTLLEHAYIVGASDSSVNLIAEINDKELVDAMNLNADKKARSAKARNFADVLEMFMPSKNVVKGKAGKGETVFTDETSDMSDFIKKQRDKLSEKNGGEQ